MASIDDLVTVGNSLNKNIASLIQALIANNTTNAASIVSALQAGLPVITGTFTCANNTNTVVTETRAAANSIIMIMPTNAAAGTLQASGEAVYLSARTAGASFTVKTAAGGAAAGTETFQYLMVNP
jgi:hypothetical protein